ncbi:MAG: antitoxin VapB family protein [Candidatus Micrarchaeota archaeon]|mgnify:CR=1 FL=1|nr:hypothetical protein [Candidatus Micrarchaeota archaeon]
MVRVITIMDDVYAELYRIKRAKGMSFSEVLRYLVKEREEKRNILVFAGSISELDIDTRVIERMKRNK